MTIGEKRIRVQFDPSNMDSVFLVKSKTATMYTVKNVNLYLHNERTK